MTKGGERMADRHIPGTPSQGKRRVTIVSAVTRADGSPDFAITSVPGQK
jgi:hypothetical protein